MSDIECPECGYGQQIDHDDGYGYEEGVLHEQECPECEKTFVFTTSISFYYEAHKAPCLNGASHRTEVKFSDYSYLKNKNGVDQLRTENCKFCDYNESRFVTKTDMEQEASNE